MGLYEPVSRSLRIEGYSTSVRLERIFWEVLEQIAREEQLSTCALVSSIYREFFSCPAPPRNFSSVLRVICLRHMGREGAFLEPVGESQGCQPTEAEIATYCANCPALAAR